MFELVLNNYLFIQYLVSSKYIRYQILHPACNSEKNKKEYLSISLVLLEVGKVKTGMTSQTR